MKKHLSLIMLAARSTFYKLIFLLIIMGTVQITLFHLTLQNNSIFGLERAISQSHIPLVFKICFLILCTFTSMTGCELHGSKVRYTIQRLSISEKTVTLWWAAYNTACFIIFWAVELAIVLILYRIYMSYGDPRHIGSQTLFLAAYRSKFIHSLLPLSESSRYVRNLLLFFGLGVSSACFSYNMRHDKKSMAVIFLAAVTAIFFQKEMGAFLSDISLSLV